MLDEPNLVLIRKHLIHMKMKSFNKYLVTFRKGIKTETNRFDVYKQYKEETCLQT